MQMLTQFLEAGALHHFTWGHLLMVLVGLGFLYLAIAKECEPLLLVPIGFGIIVGNIPFAEGMELGLYEEGTVLNILYQGVRQGIYPPLIFLGLGAMTDFSSMLSNPKLVLLGAAAQAGIFLTLCGALLLGFDVEHAAAIGIIGGADGPTAIFLSSRLAPDYLGPIAIAAYSYMALVPVIHPPIIRLLTTREERLIRMKRPREVSRKARIAFPVAGFILAVALAPGSMPLLALFFLGNLLSVCGVTERLASTARNALIDSVTILLGLTVGASTDAGHFLTPESTKIFLLGAVAFCCATASGVLFAKLMNLFCKEKVNPIIGAAGVSAVPESARVAQSVGAAEDPQNFLIMHAMAANVSGVIGSAVAAGVLLAALR